MYVNNLFLVSVYFYHISLICYQFQLMTFIILLEMKSINLNICEVTLNPNAIRVYGRLKK